MKETSSEAPGLSERPSESVVSERIKRSDFQVVAFSVQVVSKSCLTDSRHA
jgi:hypothetical protein